MTSITMDDARELIGGTAYGPDQSKLGKVADVYIDADTKQPEWALVETGAMGSRQSFVPLAEATSTGGGLQVPYTQDEVKDAPSAEPDGELSQEEESRLYAHYGLSYSESASDSGLPVTGAPVTGAPVTGAPVSGAPVAAPVRASAPASSDEAMTRSEERLRVGVQRAPSQTVRLKKWIETEQVTTTVPVTRERVRVETEPITDANYDRSVDGPEMTDRVHEVTLTEERPVVDKKVVPVERVRLDKEAVTETETVSGQVRKEHIALDEDAATDRR